MLRKIYILLLVFVSGVGPFWCTENEASSLHNLEIGIILSLLLSRSHRRQIQLLN